MLLGILQGRRHAVGVDGDLFALDRHLFARAGPPKPPRITETK